MPKLLDVMAGLDPAIHDFAENNGMPCTRSNLAGWAKAPLRRAHHLYLVAEKVGTLRFAHSTAPVYIGRTSTTSGTKCLSKFWMPCWSVAVDDGQPEQAPFMLR